MSIGRSGVGMEAVDRLHQRAHGILADLRVLALHGGERRAADHRDVVAGELVARQKLAHLELDQVEQLGVVDHVDLVHVDDQRRHADLAGEQDVLARLRHRAVGGRDHQDGAVHLRRAGDHVLHVVGVPGAVDVRVVAGRRLVLDVRRVDRDAARLLFRRRVDLLVGLERPEILGDRRRQRRLAVIDVTDRADVHVRLGALEFLFSHQLSPSDFSLSYRSGVFGLNFLRDLARHLRVVIELHRVLRPPLAHRAQVVDVVEHVGERHHRVDDGGVAAHLRPLHLRRAANSGRR